MLPEVRWALVAAAALAAGVWLAPPFARLMAPFYMTVARAAAEGTGWAINDVSVAERGASGGAVLRLRGTVARTPNETVAAAFVSSDVHIGGVIQTPVLFWGLLIAWRAGSVRQRCLLMAVALPVYLALESVTTALELVTPFAQAVALLSGDPDPLTLWERWTRFIEAGGRIALAIGSALLSVSLAMGFNRIFMLLRRQSGTNTLSETLLGA